MLLLIQGSSVVGTANEGYNGPMQTIEAPADFNIDLMSDYVVVDGVATLNWQNINKTNATTLLQQTDWTATLDITNPQYSNPYLTNQPEFLSYRSTVRQIAVNPPSTEATFPPQPVATWSS
jgi:hypothetical protein